MFGEQFKGMELDTWSFQVPLKSKGFEPFQNQGVSSPIPSEIKLLTQQLKQI